MYKTIKRLFSDTMTNLAVVGLSLSLLLIGCSTENEPPPMDVAVTPGEASSTETSSPIATPAEVFNSPLSTPRRGPDFEIDESATAGDTIVRGKGPAGIAIDIVDISWAGEVKGSGVIAEDGTFEIEVTPIEGGNQIGIALKDLGGTRFVADDFQNNENYRDIPLVGFFVDTYHVPQE